MTKGNSRETMGSGSEKKKEKYGYRSGQSAKRACRDPVGDWEEYVMFKIMSRESLKEGSRPHGYLWFLSLHSAAPTF